MSVSGEQNARPEITAAVQQGVRDLEGQLIGALNRGESGFVRISPTQNYGYGKFTLDGSLYECARTSEGVSAVCTTSSEDGSIVRHAVAAKKGLPEPPEFLEVKKGPPRGWRRRVHEESARAANGDDFVGFVTALETWRRTGQTTTLGVATVRRLFSQSEPRK